MINLEKIKDWIPRSTRITGVIYVKLKDSNIKVCFGR